MSSLLNKGDDPLERISKVLDFMEIFFTWEFFLDIRIGVS